MSLLVDIRKDFGSFCLSVTFEAENGVMGILGESGSGKSMTLKCIAGIVKPDSGKIILDGVTLFDSERHVNLKPQQRHVGYLFQNYALFPNMTVRQNILCGMHAMKGRTEREMLFAKMLRAMQIEELAARYPAELSGGQQQRVALARILVSKPKLLLLDEPFSALDFHIREKLMMEMKEILKDFGGISIAVTHNRNEAYDLCDSIGLVNQGRMLTHNQTKALFADPGSIACARMTGCKNIAPAVKVGDHEVEVPDWGIHLVTGTPVRDDIVAVGIRAHYFHPRCMDNRFAVSMTKRMEEPFEVVQAFRFAGQREGTPDIWWRVPKSMIGPDGAPYLGIAPGNIHLLYGEE